MVTPNHVSVQVVSWNRLKFQFAHREEHRDGVGIAVLEAVTFRSVGVMTLHAVLVLRLILWGHI